MKKIFFIICISCTVLHSNAQQSDPTQTEIWDPEPVVVMPGNPYHSSAPSDAIHLFDGKDLREWVSVDEKKSPAPWVVSRGVISVKNGTGNIQTKRLFTDYQLHIEWMIPVNVTGKGQHRGNSGIFLGSTGADNRGYELQILDCYRNKTYANGQAASIYKQFIPLANACRKPGEWQSYDAVWTAPRFKEDGSLYKPARLTVFHNGVLVQNNVELKGETVYVGQPKYTQHGALPIMLQDHDDVSAPLSFRNIWIRVL